MVRIDVGSVKVAPPQRVTDDDPPEARAFVYHCAVSALEASKNLEPIPKIQALCSTMALDTIGTFCIRQFQKNIEEMIMNPANFTVPLPCLTPVVGSKPQNLILKQLSSCL